MEKMSRNMEEVIRSYEEGVKLEGVELCPGSAYVLTFDVFHEGIAKFLKENSIYEVHWEENNSWDNGGYFVLAPLVEIF